MKRMIIGIIIIIILCMGVLYLPNRVFGADPNLTPDNNILYIHYLGGAEPKYWLDADKDAHSNEAYETTTNELYIEFEQDPPVNENIWFLSSEEFVVNIHIEYLLTEPTSETVGVDLYVDDEHIQNVQTSEHDEDYNYQVTFGYSRDEPIVNGTKFKIGVSYDSITPAAIRLFTDGSSYIQIPCEGDNDSDDIPDSRDPDDDNDGFTDEEELQKGTDPKDPASKPSSSNGDNGNGNGNGDQPPSQSWLIILGILVIIIVIVVIILVKKR